MRCIKMCSIERLQFSSNKNGRCANLGRTKAAKFAKGKPTCSSSRSAASLALQKILTNCINIFENYDRRRKTIAAKKVTTIVIKKRKAAKAHHQPVKRSNRLSPPAQVIPPPKPDYIDGLKQSEFLTIFDLQPRKTMKNGNGRAEPVGKPASLANVPFSSDLGRMMRDRSCRQAMSEEFQLKRLERVERHINKTPAAVDDARYRVTFDRRNQKCEHTFHMPKRQHYQRCGRIDLLALCRPIEVRLERMNFTENFTKSNFKDKAKTPIVVIKPNERILCESKMLRVMLNRV